MTYRTRLNYTPELKSEIWSKYKQGESLWSIARSIDRHSSCIYQILSPSGGIPPRERTRSSRVLSLSEREEISRGLVANLSLRTIAHALNRSPSTVSREINRNGGLHHYRATQADQRAWDTARRPKACKLSLNPRLCRQVIRLLQYDWSPEQIAGWLKRTYDEDESYHVSHETIYRSLFIQTRGVLKKELQQYLRSQRTIRRSRYASLKEKGLGGLPNAVSISARPSSVEDRAVPGHWEGDLIEGSQGSCIATLVERHSRYVMLVKLDNKKTQTVTSALIKHAKKLPHELYRSLTWDRGTEMKAHQHFTLATDIQVYFCDPQSPWQRGTNENTNRLLRQYLPKGTNLAVHSQAKLNAIARQLNQRPRKTLNFETPAERFNTCVASTN